MSSEMGLPLLLLGAEAVMARPSKRAKIREVPTKREK